MRDTQSTIRKAKTVCAALAAGMLAACAFPQGAQAFDLFGVHLWGRKKADPAAQTDVIGAPKYYKVDVAAAAGAAPDGVKTVRKTSSLVADAGKPVSGSAGVLGKARGDYRRILAALYAQGRYGGVISITINGREAADLPFDTELPDKSTIVITIDSGPQYRFSQAVVDRQAPPASNRRDEVTTPQEAGYAAGDVARSTVILKAGQLAVNAWRQQGYAKAKVTGRDVVADHRSRTVEADIHVEAGRLAHLGELKLHNVSRKPRMDSAFVAWMTGLEPGQEYDPDDLAKARKRLARLDVFRVVNLREADEIRPDGSLPLHLVVQERPLHRLGAGAAYSTFDGAGFETYWLHRNLFGRAEQLRFDGKIKNIGGKQSNSYNPKNYSYLLGATLTRPGVYTPDTDFIASLRAEREVLDNYTAEGIYLHTGFTHIFSDELSGRLYLNAARTHTYDDYFGGRDFTTIGFLGGLLYDSRDDKTDAHRGLYGELVVTPFYEANYGNFITRATVEGRGYLALDKQARLVAAARVRIGAITGAQAAELPSNILFFAGGGGSVRGYGYRNIGIRTPTGDIIGGRSLVEGSAELRTMVTESVGVVGFVDAGIVGEDTTPDFRQDTKVGVGFGLRYKTGLGPVRLDIAKPLNGNKGDPALGFYIGIGQAF
ncbi:MAG: Surface antigen [Candidatus Tokpelaia hoelldobleri]|uniref:Surface antigen n=1 Tax=Candidatus Tokpelaia hoelldobleri TaxID=1902579 RepID=A0A1U9JWT3_9HYPH|nr:MAG: Surface antigen [Candidatus Tokpelaia hoelldoblerii]